MNDKKCFKCLNFLGPDNSLEYGLHAQCFLEWFGSAPQEFGQLDPKSTTNREPAHGSARSGWNTSFFVGNYRKYSAILGEEHVILKVQQNEAPELPDVEFICNRIARVAGIPNPDFYLIDFHGLRAFVTRNFVRPGSATADLKHIYHYLRGGQEHFTCEHLLEVLQEQTRRYADLETFIHVCLYDSLIGNHDRHGRNLGLLVTPRGTQLAPVYDNNSALGLELQAMLGADFNPRGKIATARTREPGMADYIEEFIRLGYGDAVRRFARGVSLERCLEIIRNGFCSEPMKEALQNLVRKRYEEMRHELDRRS